MRLLLAAFLLAGCGSAADEMRMVSRLASPVSIDVRAPKPELRGGCQSDFRTRFCAEQYESVGIVDVAPGEDRFLTLSDPVNEAQCTNVLWLRLLWLGDVGPVADPGTTFGLPAIVEIEQGAGRFHGVAFPAATVRLDELGSADANQGSAPAACPAE